MRQLFRGLTLFGLGSLCGSALALDPSLREFAALREQSEANRAAARSSLGSGRLVSQAARLVRSA